MSNHAHGAQSSFLRLLDVIFFAVVFSVMLICSRHCAAQEFSFLNITDLPGGPGQGSRR